MGTSRSGGPPVDYRHKTWHYIYSKKKLFGKIFQYRQKMHIPANCQCMTSFYLSMPSFYLRPAQFNFYSIFRPPSYAFYRLALTPARMSGIVFQPVTVSDHMTRSPIAQIKTLILGIPNTVSVNSHCVCTPELTHIKGNKKRTGVSPEFPCTG